MNIYIFLFKLSTKLAADFEGFSCPSNDSDAVGDKNAGPRWLES